jgi:toxin YhaV
VIPSDPSHTSFLQGDTLGKDYRRWSRAKYLQQYRMFFRYRQSGSLKIIVLGWVNYEKTLRAYGSRTDAYFTFRKMLDRGHPPNDWDALLAEAIGASDRVSQLHIP